MDLILDSEHSDPRALVLHADPAVLRSLGDALRARRVETLAAEDGAGGVRLLLDELLRLDVLVADARLPGRDASAFLRLVREAGGERDLGVVVLAGGLCEVERAGLVALGADAVVDASDPELAADAILDVARARRIARRPGLERLLAGALRPWPRFAGTLPVATA